MSGDLKDMRAYSRGYEDGRRSKDADHAAVAIRLSNLRFDGGSHENLSKIAYAIYPCATGWTCESSKGLRDRLIDLLGGVHEHRCDAGRSCARGDSHACGVGEPTEAMTYDVLGNERHKAVCRLREWEPDEDGMPRRELWEAVMGEELPTVPLKGDAELDIIMRDRLIYLLGGDQPTSGTVWEAWGREWQDRVSKANAESDDQPTPSDLYGILQDDAESENKGAESVPEMTKNAEIGKLDGDWTSPNGVGTCPNDSPTSSITDELRDYLGENGQEYDNYKGEMIGSISGGLSPIYVIADRIDEQAKTLEHDVEMWRDRSEDMRMERDDLQAKLEEADAAIANWRERERSFDAAQDKLDAIREALGEARCLTTEKSSPRRCSR